MLAAVLMTSRADATPLGVMWKVGIGCPDPERHHPFESERGLVWTDHGKLVRWARETGSALSPIKIKGKNPWIAAATRELILVRDGVDVTELDPTLHVKWRHPAPPLSEVAIAGGDVAIVGAAVKGKRTVELLDGATGKAKWTAALASPNGFIGFVVATSEHVVVALTPEGGGEDTPSTLTAFALADGAQKWTYKTPSGIAWAAPAGARAVGDTVAVSTKDALVLVGPDGKAATIALARATLRRVLGGRLYGDTWQGVWAIDVPARKQLWASPLTGATFVAASDDVVYAVGHDEVISEIDPKTGKVGPSTFAVGGQQIFGFESAPHLIACDEHTAFALDSSMPDLAMEAVTISGKVECEECSAVEVHAGAARTTTDAKGAFTLKTTARGTLQVAVQLGDATVNVKTVHLDGSHTYQLGAVKVEMPMRGD